MKAEAFERSGFALVPDVLPEDEIARATAAIESLAIRSAGSRCLLDHAWCRELARGLREASSLRSLVPGDAVPIQCTLFDKTERQNWLVAFHQDRSIPVAKRVEHPALGGWSEKEGRLFVQAPAEVLESLVAVRLHLDDCRRTNGPLRVVPGSHRAGLVDAKLVRSLREKAGEEVCEVPRRGAVVMKPLLLHASTKATQPGRRRVLHFLFAPPTPGYGLQWPSAA